MLPALPVEAISAEEATMAGAAKGTVPSGKAAPSGEAGPSARTPAAGKKGRSARQAPAKAPAAKGSAGTAPATRSAGGSRTAEPAAGKAAAKPGRAGKGGAAKAADLPVREGEGHWTATELAEVRAGLEEQIVALREEIAASAVQIAEGDINEGAGDDQADAGAKTYEREHELALAYNSRDLLAQIERAVQRMEAGTYGICESCVEPIGKARLQVFPRATLCVTCKQREERR
ncbi:TraR/DksA family transcriptional regulator [Actinomadura sp. LD22]|uniref:TraR/DksA family transcriptional regulator n=1 Tax=Actinomadura physcomitrii TaxID=2650748 RepID=A0A6I4MF05_9ACTN|nr:TraR/DksA family transcriptional regulator [Actinomadura physcomitrii]